MIFRPQKLSDNTVVANTSFLVPHFEETRARLLAMPFEEDIHIVTYEEHWNYHITLYESVIWATHYPPC
jgi:hypothetical protein